MITHKNQVILLQVWKRCSSKCIALSGFVNHDNMTRRGGRPSELQLICAHNPVREIVTRRLLFFVFVTVTHKCKLY